MTPSLTPPATQALRPLLVSLAFALGLALASSVGEAGTSSLALGDLGLESPSGLSPTDSARIRRGALSAGDELLLQAPLRHAASGSFEVSWGVELSREGSADPQTLSSGSGWNVPAHSEQDLAAGVRLPTDLLWGRYLLELNVVAGSRRLTTSRYVHVGEAADLELSEFSLTSHASGAALSLGERVGVEVLVTNRGQRSASESVLDLRFSRNDAITAYDPAGGQIRIAPLSAGASRRERFDVVVPSDLGAGSYYLGARADAERDVDEIVEGGSASTSHRHSVQAATGQPDLAAVEVRPRARSASPGGSLEVARTIRNHGQGPSGSIAYALLLSSDGALDAADREIWRGTLASLDPGAESAAEVSVRLPGDLRPGTYRLGLRVDPDDLLTESREDDNELLGTTSLEVTGAPTLSDLEVSALRPATYTTRPGDELRIERSLLNSGADAGPFSYTLVLSTDARIDAQDEVIYTYRYYEGLDAGERRSGSVTTTIPRAVRPGDYWIGLRLDPEQEVPESSEANTRASSFAIRVERGESVLRFDPSQVYMNDGDTLRVDGQSYRLLGYDTPEKSSGAFNGNQEPHASRATAHARGLLYGAQELALHLGERDRYGRVLAHAFLDGRSLAIQMIEAEQAYETIRIFGNGGFYELGGEIIQAARGRTPPFEAPYRWRQSHSR